MLFDVLTGQNAHRERLRRYLRDKGFGYLQNSVWITPDPLTAEREVLGGSQINVKSLILLEARPCAGESDAEMVAGAWDFERINRRYVRHLEISTSDRVTRLGTSRQRRTCCVGVRRNAKRGWTR